MSEETKPTEIKDIPGYNKPPPTILPREEVEQLLQESANKSEHLVDTIAEDFKERRNAIVQVSNNLTSSRFVLALVIILPAMFCYGYGMRLAGETGFKDVLHMVDNLVVMIVTFYFCQQQYKDSNGKNGNGK
jgi:hypothetical protein